MSAVSIRTAVENLWNGWTSTKYTFENERFDTPSEEAWCRVSIREGTGDFLTIGPSSIDRHTGLVYIQVFVPVFEGDTRGRILADLAAGRFRKKKSSNVTFKVPYFDVVGIKDGWWCINVICPYFLDEVIQ